MAKLKTRARNKLPSSAFVFPKERAFPVHDLAHGRAAMRLCGRSSIKNACKKVAAKVCKKFGKQIKACSKRKK